MKNEHNTNIKRIQRILLFLLIAGLLCVAAIIWFWNNWRAQNPSVNAEQTDKTELLLEQEPYKIFFANDPEARLAQCIWENNRECFDGAGNQLNVMAFIGKPLMNEKSSELGREFDRMSLFDFAVYCVLEYNHSINIVRYLLQRPQKPTFRPDGSAPYCIQAASRVGSIEMVRLLVEAGANPHAFQSDTAYPILLERAVELEDKELVEEIVRRGCNINGKQPTGWTLPLECLYYKKWDFVHYFLNHGADTNIKTSNGVTFLSLLEQQQKEFEKNKEVYPEQFDALLRRFR